MNKTDRAEWGKHHLPLGVTVALAAFSAVRKLVYYHNTSSPL